MTAREFIQKLIEECPNLDRTTIYIQKFVDKEPDPKDYVIKDISNGGTNDAIFIEIEDWHL